MILAPADKDNLVMDKNPFQPCENAPLYFYHFSPAQIVMQGFFFEEGEGKPVN
jgi:hypothetical protein